LIFCFYEPRLTSVSSPLVVAASNDYANQGILSRVRKADPTGERSLGIITKPDRLDPGSPSELKFIELAENEDVSFNLGWHVLRNRGFTDGNSSYHQRNSTEMDFFENSLWSSLPLRQLGIDALRTRLTQVLFEHLHKELPNLHKELDSALTKAKSDLEKLGRPRSDVKSCRRFLAEESMKVHNILKAAVEGTYEHEFFADWADTEPIPGTTENRRLRAQLQLDNAEFATRISKKGSAFMMSDGSGVPHPTIINTSPTPQSSTSNPPPSPSAPPQSRKRKATALTQAADPPIVRTRADMLEWVKNMLKRSRGRELSGTFNPLIIGDLFWKKSQRWASLAAEHTETVHKYLAAFVKDVIESVLPQGLHSRVWGSMCAEKLQVSTLG
jgi:hypothetical protein